MMYDKNTVYVIGQGKTSLDNAITDKFNMFFINFIIDTENDEVVDLACTAMIPTTQEFIASIFVGNRFDKYYEEIENEILRRYFGTSRKAIVIAYKDALKKYLDIKKKFY